MTPGIEKAWEVLSSLRPEDVAKGAGVLYKDKEYIVRSLGMDFAVNLSTKQITALNPEGEFLVKRLGYFFNHSLLWYLIGAKDAPATGRLIKPQSLKGGHHFFSGSHELPLQALASKYGSDREGFLKKGTMLGARVLSYGDASVELYPLPRIPITIILWLSDEEFPERADLLFDSTIEIHLPLDIIWSVAMFTLLSML